MEFLKERYKELIFNGLISLAVMLIVLWVTGFLNAQESQQELINTKASKSELSKAKTEAKKYTDDQIELHSKTEKAYREGQQKQIDEISKKTDVIYQWVINQKK